MSVDFSTENHQAKEIYIAVGGSVIGEKDKILAGLLATFLGAFGIHKFYLGYKVPGIIFLVINTVGWLITPPSKPLPLGRDFDGVGWCRVL